ncbi:cellulose biosynthesis cyclic di-GMP-binding regulatory protein BcsB [Paenibacillus pasadenensis]|uniref:cellulose biosynthesis cyclic di-GMP-binding regulatory protein BcsB n=1 Tax=Paenibacillus pasadenensis TaxID=217090 RepID=UPI00203B0544|nr:cellulose biosynthesis cyclic di-GMP-binding regulatory protein BcsB [Paenibacillus pasadenensis]MCM3749008.1 cellulose biosynthesis cyclic di-GMP-binding regulatory protein BcsB [Paenibacillus pasadenensis]
MKNWLSVILSLSLLTAAAAGIAQPAAASSVKQQKESPPAVQQQSKPGSTGALLSGEGNIRLPYRGDVKLQGQYAAQSAFFTLSEHWKLRSGRLHLEFGVSSLSRDAALTVEVNGKPIHSIDLSRFEESGGTLDLAIQADDLITGSNEVRISFNYAEGEVGICADARTDENWVLIREQSYLDVSYANEKPTLELRQFPYPFVPDAGDRTGKGTSIVLPDNPSRVMIAAALQTAAALGVTAEEGLSGLHMGTYSEIAAGNHRKDHLIYVGPASTMPEALKPSLPQEALSRLEEGPLLYRALSPLQADRLLMGIVSGSDDTTLDAAARLLQNPDLASQLVGSTALLPLGTNVNRTAIDASRERWTIQQLGSPQGIKVQGPFQQQANFDLKLPSNKLVLPGAKASFKLKYAKNLNFSQSLATMYVNGIPAGSKKLTAEAADADVWEVTIPSQAAQSGYLAMSVVFDLQMSDYNCARGGEQTPWAYVEPDSTISLPSEDERTMLLEHYPWPFIKNGRWNEAAFILPEQVNGVDLSLQARMAARLGSFLTDNSASLQVRPDKSWETEELKGFNLIVAGTAKDSELLRSINHELWFGFDANFERFVGNEKRRLLPEFASQLASVQLISSPSGDGTGILAVTAPDSESLLQAEKYVTERSFGVEMVGNATLIDRWEKALHHYFSEDDSPTIGDRVNLSSGQMKVFAILFGTMLLMLILGIVLLWRKYRKR